MTTTSSTDELAYTGIDFDWWKVLFVAGLLMLVGGMLYLIRKRA